MNDTANDPILIHRFTTPLGAMFVCATAQGVCLLEFACRSRLETEFEELQFHLDSRIIAGDNAHIRLAVQQLTDYFAGKLTRFSVPLHMPGTPFQQRAWQALQQIPYGETVSYQQHAERLGRPEAVRAVAAANGQNRIAIIVPCHRVLGKDGSLTGYGGGLQRKQWLLDHERGRHTPTEHELF